MNVEISKIEGRPLCSKAAQSIELIAFSPKMENIFDRVSQSAAVACVLFGGALCDSDFAVRLPGDEMQDGSESCWTQPLSLAFGGFKVEWVTGLGTGRLHHVVTEDSEIVMAYPKRLAPKFSQFSLVWTPRLDRNALRAKVAL